MSNNMKRPFSPRDAKDKNSYRGFTLIELLVAISIIGLLAAIVLTSVNSARAKARDAKRKSDLSQIMLALEMYHLDHGTYLIPDTGHLQSGEGYFNVESDDAGHYAKSIFTGLKEEGYFTDEMLDPLVIVNTEFDGQYMVYDCNGVGIFIYAHLEMPTPAEVEHFQTTCPTEEPIMEASYDMNYVIGHF